jgi:CheY-like chemotaxis protein
MGVGAPALVLTSPCWDQVVGGGDDYLAKREGLTGSTLVRAIVALVERRELTEQVAAAGAQAERASKILADLTHDLATPLGVVMGMTQVLLTDDNGLNDDGRSCLEDVAREALRASEILKGCNSVGLAASTSPVPVVQEPSVRRAIPPGVGSKMVLIADDDPATRRLVCATLASDRYSVVEAADGKEAWRLIREHNPAVAILDWQMPVYSGLELTGVIKGDPLIRDMTVIMLTGRSGPADRAAGERAHADLYLVKPFSPYELLRAVEQALSVN